MFQTTKIQTFESNSQLIHILDIGVNGCFRPQRYKLLKAIHNGSGLLLPILVVVSDYKDTNFWKQFTTASLPLLLASLLFQTTKIQTFESNSQRHRTSAPSRCGCFRLQRYKLLKAIHNLYLQYKKKQIVVSDYKDTNFWKQLTTGMILRKNRILLFQTTKTQTFESNSQLSVPLSVSL